MTQIIIFGTIFAAKKNFSRLTKDCLINILERRWRQFYSHHQKSIIQNNRRGWGTFPSPKKFFFTILFLPTKHKALISGETSGKIRQKICFGGREVDSLVQCGEWNSVKRCFFKYGEYGNVTKIPKGGGTYLPYTQAHWACLIASMLGLMMT